MLMLFGFTPTAACLMLAPRGGTNAIYERCNTPLSRPLMLHRACLGRWHDPLLVCSPAHARLLAREAPGNGPGRRPVARTRIFGRVLAMP